MLITRTTRARRCELPEDQTKNNCTSPAHLESIAVSVGPETQCCSAPAPVPRP